MSSLKTFIAALRTGETHTTKALDALVARRSGAAAAQLIAALNTPGALNAPLQNPLRAGIQTAPLSVSLITACIDGWPDAQKEKMRIAVAAAIHDRRPVRFAWGLTPESGFRTKIHDTGTGEVTITALTPRSALRSHVNGTVDAMP